MYRFVRKISTMLSATALFIGLFISTNATAQNACDSMDFTITQATGCTPKNVTFDIPYASTVAARNDTAAYYWDFDDPNDAVNKKGTFSIAGSKTSHVYSAAGTYNPRLKIVYTKNGSTLCTKIFTNKFIIKTLGSVKFGAVNLKFCGGPYKMKLIDSTTGGVEKCFWIISGPNGYTRVDTTFGKLSSDTFTLPTTGNYTVLLQVFDSSGCSHYLTKTNYISLPDVLSAGLCATLTEDSITHTNIKLELSPKMISGASYVSAYVFDWGDGSPVDSVASTATFPRTHNYSSIDTSKKYSVSLRVYATNGCTTFVSYPKLVTKHYFVAKKNKYCMGANDTVMLTKSSLSGGLHLNTFSTDITSTNSPIKTNSDTVTFKFSNIGSVKMTMSGYYKGLFNCNVQLVIPAIFTILPPKAGINKILDGSQCSPPDTVHVRATKHSVGNTYKWYLSYDTIIAGKFAQKQIATKTNTVDSESFIITPAMLSFGKRIFSVKLVINNSNGCSDSATSNGSIFIAKPSIFYRIHDTDVCIGETVHFIDSTQPVDSTVHPYQYNWTLAHQTITSAVINRYIKKPDISFAFPGIYDLTLTVTNTLVGCSSRISKKNAVKVNGVIVDSVTMTATNYCTPIKNGDITLNSYIGQTIPSTSTLKYAWSISPAFNSTGGRIAKINDSTVANPSKIQITTSGSYDISLTIINTFGAQTCTTTVNKPGLIYLGTQAAFTTNKTGCINTPINLISSSSGNPTAFAWACVSANKSDATFSASTNDTCTVSFSKPGVYAIQLSVGKQGNKNCNSTINDTITITRPVAHFYSNDRFKICAPQLVTFFDSSQGAVKYIWDYGDGKGDTTANTIVYHDYKVNNSSGYTIALIVEDANGCKDTDVQTSYIQLVGPVAKFSFTPHSACGDSTMTFTNLSSNIKKITFDYKDGSPLDSFNFVARTHKYKYADYSQPSVKYYPILIVSDNSANPCYAFFTDSITLYRPPLASFDATTPTSGCTPLTVTFKDKGKYHTKVSWDFDGDGNYDTVTNAGDDVTHTFTTTGAAKTFSVRTKVESANCADTFSHMNYITVHGLPKADFDYTPKNLKCFNDPYTFTSSSTTPDGVIGSYSWDFGDGGTDNTGSVVQHNYTVAGTYTVSLAIVTNFGCKDSIAKDSLITITAPSRPIAPSIKCVTVDRNHMPGTPADVHIYWNKSTDPVFKQYDIYRMGSPITNISTITTINTDNYSDPSSGIDVNAQSYGYSLSIADQCGLFSDTAYTHQTIYLTATPSVAGTTPAVQLAWSTYHGWDSIGGLGPKGYELYRNDTNDLKYSLLATLKATDSTYLDASGLCDKNYRYYVKAIHQTDTAYNSFSNKVVSRPAYTYQLKPIELSYTTVVNNEYTLTKWVSGSQPNIKAYHIDKWDKTNGWVTDFDIVGPTVTSYIDKKVDVLTGYYRYRVAVEDSCGNITRAGTGNPRIVNESNLGTSIMLTCAINNDMFDLTWNEYKDFPQPFSNYILQYKDVSGTWTPVVSRNIASDTTATDTLSHSDMDSATCFRVVAIDNFPGFTDTSISNSTCCYLPSRVFVPTAFTPTWLVGSKLTGVTPGLNDEFNISALSIFNSSKIKDLQYTFTIYDRWGTRVFETHDKHKGWNGTFIDNGNPCPADVYVYVVEAHAFDRKHYFKKGLIHLLR
ncbi:MAG: PKD domain-containing protein [Bacteroidetes bacterium]|nr:PKD domain-containing protein [Bacteroidota bacterium]